MFDHSTLAVTSNSDVYIFKLTSDYKFEIIDRYGLPFKEYEKVSIGVSSDKNFIAVGGHKHIFVSKQV